MLPVDSTTLTIVPWKQFLNTAHCSLKTHLIGHMGRLQFPFLQHPVFSISFGFSSNFLNCTVLLYCLEILPLRSVHTERGNLGLSNSFLLVDYGNFAETLILRVKKCFAQIYPLEIQISHSVLDKWGIYLSFADDLWIFLNLVFVFLSFLTFTH